MRTVKAGTLEKLVGHLVPAFQGSNLSYVTVFLCTYRAFTTTQQVLDLLFERGAPRPQAQRLLPTSWLCFLRGYRASLSLALLGSKPGCQEADLTRLSALWDKHGQCHPGPGHGRGRRGTWGFFLRCPSPPVKKLSASPFGKEVQGSVSGAPSWEWPEQDRRGRRSVRC